MKNEMEVVVTQQPGKIDCNFADIEADLTLQMTAYETLEVTEDNIPERKADVATLRKYKGEIEDRRKAVKKEYNKPLKEFEDKVKRLTGIIDEQIDRLNTGLAAFEEKRRAEKQKAVEEIYQREVSPEMQNYLPLGTIFRDKWLNKTCAEKEIVSDMQEMILAVKNDLGIIQGLNSEIESALIAEYVKSGNMLAAAIRKNTEYNDAKRLAEERIRMEQAKKDAQKPIDEILEPPQGKIPEQPENAPERTPDMPEWTVTILGAENIKSVRAYFEMFGITYREGI